MILQKNWKSEMRNYVCNLKMNDENQEKLIFNPITCVYHSAEDSVYGFLVRQRAFPYTANCFKQAISQPIIFFGLELFWRGSLLCNQFMYDVYSIWISLNLSN